MIEVDFLPAFLFFFFLAFGFSAGNVYRYQGITDPQQRREVIDKYWANYSAHHISPYDPAPLDRVEVTWPNIQPPKSKWQGGRPVANEKHSGERSLLVFDDRRDANVEAVYEPLVPIPEGGLRLRFWYRTAIPGQVFLVTLNHHDASGQWISGGNNDIGLEGNGRWQEFDRTIRRFPQGAKSAQLRLRAANWTESGEHTGLVWFDDVSLTDAASGKELIEAGGFEPPELPQVERDKLQVKLDFTAWDKAMERGTGARALRSIIEEVMLDIMYQLPSRRNVSKCIINRDTILKSNEPIYLYEERKSA